MAKTKAKKTTAEKASEINFTDDQIVAQLHGWLQTKQGKLLPSYGVNIEPPELREEFDKYLDSFRVDLILEHNYIISFGDEKSLKSRIVATLTNWLVRLFNEKPKITPVPTFSMVKKDITITV